MLTLKERLRVSGFLNIKESKATMNSKHASKKQQQPVSEVVPVDMMIILSRIVLAVAACAFIGATVLVMFPL